MTHVEEKKVHEGRVMDLASSNYLEDLREMARRAYYWNSFDPEARADSDRASYESQLRQDLEEIPEGKRQQYIESYKSRLSSLFTSKSRCANAMVTGPAKFNFRQNEKRENAYWNKYEEFNLWRERFLAAMKRAQEATRPEEEKQEEAVRLLLKDLEQKAETIHELDTGKLRGYNRALFVGSIYNKVATYASHGEVEIVQRAVDFIAEFNSMVKKPVITARNRFFQLPEIAARMREKLHARKNEENKEAAFEGGKVVWNHEADRLQILFDNIPDDAMRSCLKSNGFRWSPKYKAWQRQLTLNAVYAARRVLNLQDL